MKAHATAILPIASAAPASVQRSCDCGIGPVMDEPCPACADQSGHGARGPAIGPADDPLEREAEAVADHLVPQGGAASPIRRDLAQGDDEALHLSRPAAAPRRLAPQAGAIAAAAVAGGGAPLAAAERAFFEPRFGRDLGHVRLHTDAVAGLAARGIGARAYALRNHIAFAPGQFAPGTRDGRRLIAHELTHTLQQGGQMLRRLPFSRQGPDQDGRDRNDDPRGPGQSTLTYAQARELTDCIRIIGDNDIARAECAETVLGIPMPEWKSVPGISSPVPFRAGVSAAGVATTRIGPVNLTILPDTTTADVAMQNRAHTEISFAPLPAGTNFVDWVSHGGRVSSFVFNQDVFALTIQTTYGPGAGAGIPSGYGRGTTRADRATGQTSLGHHEGEHGRDFITYLRDHPYPVFAGRTGQPTAVFHGHVLAFQGALTAYVRAMTRMSELRTDCAGTSIDTLNAARGTATTTCVRQPGDPTP